MIFKTDKKDFNEVYRIMEDSFPENERRTYAEQAALLDSEGYNLFAFRESADADIEGFVGFWKLNDLLFIEHIAVDAVYRSKGIGSEMLEEITKKCNFSPNRKTYNGIVLEVELPNDPVAVSRIKFYERHGFFLNKYDYVQPPMKENMEFLPLYIMSYGRELSGEEFIAVRNILYREIYHYKFTE